MAIFSRSKKGKPTPTTPPRPYLQSTATLNQQSTQQPSRYQPNWTYLEQRPHTSHGPPAQAQGWLIAPVPPQYQPVLVHQDHLPPLPQRPKKSGGNISKLNLSSMSNLLASNGAHCGAKIIQNGVSPLYMQGTQYLNQSAALCDLITSKFDNIITLIDGEQFSGDERELAVMSPPQPMWKQQQEESAYSERALGKGKSKGMVNNSVSSALTSTNYFAKVYLYANSRLPPNLPPLKLYVLLSFHQELF